MAYHTDVVNSKRLIRRYGIDVNNEETYPRDENSRVYTLNTLEYVREALLIITSPMNFNHTYNNVAHDNDLENEEKNEAEYKKYCKLLHIVAKEVVSMRNARKTAFYDAISKKKSLKKDIEVTADCVAMIKIRYEQAIHSFRIAGKKRNTTLRGNHHTFTTTDIQRIEIEIEYREAKRLVDDTKKALDECVERYNMLQDVMVLATERVHLCGIRHRVDHIRMMYRKSQQLFTSMKKYAIFDKLEDDDSDGKENAIDMEKHKMDALYNLLSNAMICEGFVDNVVTAKRFMINEKNRIIEAEKQHQAVINKIASCGDVEDCCELKFDLQYIVNKCMGLNKLYEEAVRIFEEKRNYVKDSESVYQDVAQSYVYLIGSIDVLEV